jgi:capsular polysaccharide biosynthesis protein
MAPESVQIESNSMRILHARSIVFEPHQDVFLQGRRAFKQHLGSDPRWRLVNEAFSGLDSELVQWSYRRTAIISSAGISKSKRLESGILINGRFPSNYYHWVINILPKVFLVEKQGTVPKAVPVLVSGSVQGTPAEEALRLVVGGRREIIFLPDEPHHVLDAYVVETAVPEIAQLSGSKNPRLDSIGGFNFSFMMAYRQFFLDALEKAFPGGEFSPPRVFLSRSNTVRPFNQNDVRKLLEERGFVTVKIEDHTFLEQVKIFAGAQIIVSITGAQWTGAIFSRGAQCLIMVPDFLSRSSVFSKLLHLGNGRIFEIPMDVAESTWNQYYNTRTLGYVDIGQLEKVLSSLEAR